MKRLDDGGSAMTTLVECSCLRRVRIAREHEGRKFRCPRCGNILSVPKENGATAPVPTLPPTAPRRSPSDRKLPGIAIAVVILNFLDAGVVGLVALLLLLAGLLLNTASDVVEEAELKTPATAHRAEIQKNGGVILEDRILVRSDGTRIRRIVSKDPRGTRHHKREFVAQSKEISGKKDELVAEVKQVGGLVLLGGAFLCLSSLGKILSGIGLLLRKNWGRLGLMGLCSCEVILLIVLILSGASGLFLILNLILNAGTAVYLLTRRVRQGIRFA